MSEQPQDLPTELRITDPIIIRHVVEEQRRLAAGEKTAPLTRIAGLIIDRYVTMTRPLNQPASSAA